MKNNIVNAVVVTLILVISGVYYYHQNHNNSASQVSPTSLLNTLPAIPAVANANIERNSTPITNKRVAGVATGLDDTPRFNLKIYQITAAGEATGLDDVSGDMSWFYTRFGRSTWFDESKFSANTFTASEYENLIAASRSGNESATVALKLSIFKHLKSHPNDGEYKELKDKLWSKEFLLSLPRFGYLITVLPDELMDDKEFIFKVLAKNGGFLKFVSKRLRADKEIVLKAISRYHLYSLQYASDAIRGDKKFVTKVLEKNAQGLCYLSDKLRSDKAFVETYISRDKHALRCLSNGLLADKKYVLELIKKKNLSLTYVKGNLSDDKDVVIAALKNSPEFYYSASKRLQNDSDILPIIRAYLLNSSSRIYSALPEKLRGDREVMKKVVAQNCHLLQSATPEIKDDDEIVRIAFARSRSCLRYASDRLKKELKYVENQDFEWHK